MPNPSKKNPASSPASSPSQSKISPAREVAFKFLRELAGPSQLHSDELLQSPKMEKLSAQDKNLCTALVMGVLRWQLALDAQIAPLLTHKTRLDEPVRVALRLGAFQLLMLDRIPVHAAISDSVELTKRNGHRFASGLVNAVLRKLALSRDQEFSASLPAPAMSAAQAHPAWLLARWKTALGDAATKAICNYDQQLPVTTLRLTSPAAEASLLAEDIVFQPGSFLTAARQVTSGSLNNHAEEDGRLRLQDEGSQLVAELLGRSSEITSILDCCAAPGGKTAILAERYPSARVVAWDISERRLAKLQERFKSPPLLARIQCRIGDAIVMPVEELFDLILCDVPCSGTGTLARNPEIKLRLVPEELPRQQERQIAILSAALRHLAPGGCLLYSTCSLEPEENEDAVARVLANENNIRLIPIAQRIAELLADSVLHAEGARHLLQHAVRGDFLRTIPGITPCDGFFAALLTRD